jgi:hypothetical protein
LPAGAKGLTKTVVASPATGLQGQSEFSIAPYGVVVSKFVVTL